MKTRVSLPAVFFFVFQACSSQGSKPERARLEEVARAPYQDTVAKQPPARHSDTLFVTDPCAVYYQPDSAQMAKRMKAVGEADFRAGMDDYLYSMNESIAYLEKKGLPVIDAEGYKYLHFQSPGKRTQLIRLDTLEELWGIYFFDPEKKAAPADIIEIDKAYADYF